MPKLKTTTSAIDPATGQPVTPQVRRRRKRGAKGRITTNLSRGRGYSSNVSFTGSQIAFLLDHGMMLPGTRGHR